MASSEEETPSLSERDRDNIQRSTETYLRHEQGLWSFQEKIDRLMEEVEDSGEEVLVRIFIEDYGLQFLYDQWVNDQFVILRERDKADEENERLNPEDWARYSEGGLEED